MLNGMGSILCAVAACYLIGKMLGYDSESRILGYDQDWTDQWDEIEDEMESHDA